ncbi:MAG: hypothetical protein RR232_01465 [Clostridia bacterium]
MEKDDFESDICDLDPNKICDNCCRCLDLDERDYNTVLADFLYEDTLIECVEQDHFAAHRCMEINTIYGVAGKRGKQKNE